MRGTGPIPYSIGCQGTDVVLGFEVGARLLGMAARLGGRESKHSCPRSRLPLLLCCLCAHAAAQQPRPAKHTASRQARLLSWLAVPAVHMFQHPRRVAARPAPPRCRSAPRLPPPSSTACASSAATRQSPTARARRRCPCRRQPRPPPPSRHLLASSPPPTGWARPRGQPRTAGCAPAAPTCR